MGIHGMKRLIRIGLMLVGVMALLSACSKTVEWEEEVLLNTGETIWVKRVAQYSYGGDAGNPLDMAYRLDGSPTLQFTYQEKKYYFHERIGVMLLAISPNGVPLLVAAANSGRWDAVNKYQCTYPFYVQFVPDKSGKKWSWPPAIETWLYGLPRNLLADYGTPEKMRDRFTMKQKEDQSFLKDPRLSFAHRIDVNYTGDLCKQRRNLE